MISSQLISSTCCSTIAGKSCFQQLQQSRNMATLKEISVRLKSTQNIQKITASMKMVSAAKFSRAERDLSKNGRALGIAVKTLYETVGLKQEASPKKKLAIAISSDRGLCGGIHSSIAKGLRAEFAKNPNVEYGLVFVGDKCRSILQRNYGKNILMHFSEVGRKPPTYLQAAAIAEKVVESGFQYDAAEIWFNEFKSAISYKTGTLAVFSPEKLAQSEQLTPYEVEDDIMKHFSQFHLANSIFYCQMEATASEQSSRMQAMENATKNASEMIQALRLLFNRTRQAVITRELIEIISGASALE